MKSVAFPWTDKNSTLILASVGAIQSVVRLTLHFLQLTPDLSKLVPEFIPVFIYLFVYNVYILILLRLVAFYPAESYLEWGRAIFERDVISQNAQQLIVTKFHQIVFEEETNSFWSEQGFA